MHPCFPHRFLRLKLLLLLLPALLAAAVAFAQFPIPPVPEDTDVRLPSGKSQKEEILKADHEKSLEDATKLTELTEELKVELEKNDRHVVSVSMLKKLEEIEKLSKRIRSRLRRY
jgi:hypothetical protein